MGTALSTATESSALLLVVASEVVFGDIDNIFSIFRSGAKRKRGAKRKKCTERKTQLCNNSYFLVTGKPDKRAKCCPDTSGCVKGALKLESNSVCSTKCGESCPGTIDKGRHPKVFCAFEEGIMSQELGLKSCYDDIAKPLCEDLTDPSIDVGEDDCSDEPPPVIGGSAGCDGTGLVCCDDPVWTTLTCDDAGASFNSYTTDLLSVLLLAQCRPEDVPV